MNSPAASPKPSSGTDQDDQCRPAGALTGWASWSVDPVTGLAELARLVVAGGPADDDVHPVVRVDDGDQQDGVTVTVFAFDVVGGRIRHIWAIRNPEKLRPWLTG